MAGPSYVHSLLAARAALSALRVPVREIACPCDPGAPLHLADYDAETETIDCIRCGRVTAARLVELLAAEMQRFESECTALAPPPPVADDEREVETVAARLFRSFPDDPDFAADCAAGWALRSLAGRLPEAHVLAAVETALEGVTT